MRAAARLLSAVACHGQFDGFVLASVTEASLRRGCPGGAWELPVFVSRVVRTAQAAPLSNFR